MSANENIEAALRELLAKQRGIDAAGIALHSRLLQDLRMDGSDAVEFFEAYRDRFEVDLSELYLKWDDYFGRETSVNLMTFLISALIAFGLIVALKALPGQIRPQWLSFLLAIVPAVLLEAFWRHRFGSWPISIVFPRLRPKQLRPITVAMLLKAAEDQAWRY